MSAIGPGDWVECINASPKPGTRKVDWRGPTIEVGKLYRVTAAFVDGTGAPVILVGWERVKATRENGFRCGYHVDRFRPVYRPRTDLIESLLQPVDGVKPTVDA